MHVDAAVKDNQMSIDIPAVTHAKNKARKVIYNNNLIGTPIFLDVTKDNVWEALMRMKAELDCLIGLVGNKSKTRPMNNFKCMVCGFKLVAQ